jgi:hypothetical protein
LASTGDAALAADSLERPELLGEPDDALLEANTLLELELDTALELTLNGGSAGLARNAFRPSTVLNWGAAATTLLLVVLLLLLLLFAWLCRARALSDDAELIALE